jgi:voltage-gated potassium channel
MKKIAIFGYNRLSLEALTRLDLSLYHILMVERNQKPLRSVVEKNVEWLDIDFRNDEELRALGIGRDVKVMFCFFSEDADNVFLTLSARALDKNLHIISIVENQGAAEKLLAAGADKIIDPYEICGRKIYGLIKKPEMTNILDHTVFGHHDLNMAEIEIPKGCRLKGCLVNELALDTKENLVLMGLVNKNQNKELYFSLEEEQHHIEIGDILVVMGASDDIKLFKKKVNHV